MIKMAKHRTIFEALHRQILSGKYSQGQRMPSESELALRFGVSRPTAARAIRDLQNLGLLNRRVGSGTYVETGAEENSTGKDKTLGLLVPGLGNTEILDPICSEITRFAQGRGFKVYWGDAAAENSPAEVQRLCQQYIERRVHGVFFAPIEATEHAEEINREIAEALRHAHIAVILLDRDLFQYPQRSQFDLVGIDNFHAGVLLTTHLVALGHRRFCFVARPGYPATTDLRIAGCRETLVRAGVPVAPGWIRIGDPADASFAGDLVEAGSPDVVICSNDRTAALLIQNLGNMKIQVPRDIGVAGFDDVAYATLLAVPLTTIRQPCAEIGRAAVYAMEERLKHPGQPCREVLLSVTLQARQSCCTRNGLSSE